MLLLAAIGLWIVLRVLVIRSFREKNPGVVPEMIVPVGFLMAFLDIDWHGDGGSVIRSGLWRLNIAADEQGKGYGRFAVESVADTMFCIVASMRRRFSCASAVADVVRLRND